MIIKVQYTVFDNFGGHKYYEFYSTDKKYLRELVWNDIKHEEWDRDITIEDIEIGKITTGMNGDIIKYRINRIEDRIDRYEYEEARVIRQELYEDYIRYRASKGDEFAIKILEIIEE